MHYDPVRCKWTAEIRVVLNGKSIRRRKRCPGNVSGREEAATWIYDQRKELGLV